MKKYTSLSAVALLLTVASPLFSQATLQPVDPVQPTVSLSHPPCQINTVDPSTGKVISSTSSVDYTFTTISVNVPSVASTEDIEYTTDPVSIPLHKDPSLPASSRKNLRFLQVWVAHPFMHHDSWYISRGLNSYIDYLKFTFKNANTIDESSVIGNSVRDNFEPSFRIIGPGEATLDFSYTKTIPGHHEGWSWTWIPEKKVTTTVHVPVTIVDDSATTDTTPAPADSTSSHSAH